jgi:hypothetical protein
LLEVDFRLHTITLNGVNRFDLMPADSQWWKLQPGVNVIQYQRTDSGASSTMTLRHRDVWS